MNFFNIYLLFWIYAFLGWILETVRISIKSHKYINRGFFLGPYCPIYGTGGVVLLLLKDYQNTPMIVFILSIFICSMIEYLTSYFLELIYHVRWWDYSNRLFNINGRICLYNSFFFGIFGLFVVCFLNPFFLSKISNLNNSFKIFLLTIIFIITTIDILITFTAMFDFRKYVNSLKEKTFTNIFKFNGDQTEEVSKRVKNSLKEKSFIHKHLLKSFNNLKVYKDSLFKKSEELIKYKKIKNIENVFILSTIMCLTICIILGYLFKNMNFFIVLAIIINLIIMYLISRGNNG